MVGLYITFGQDSKEQKTGVGLKIRNQINVFNNAGLNCQELTLPYGNQLAMRVLYRFPFYNGYPKWEYKAEFEKADYIYMRRPFLMTWYMRKTLRKVKEKNPNVKILVEIPTFPYDDEIREYKFSKIMIMKDSFNRIRMQNSIDRFVDLTGEKEIFGIPTLQIKNGIDVNAVQVKKITEHKDGSIHLCCVALFKSWHGYERLLKGLKIYYDNNPTRNVFVHFAGEGDQIPYYQALVAKHKANDFVIFHGMLQGTQLDELYNQCDFAVGSLGGYKKSLFYSQELKSREAVARGIPMITGCEVDIFTKDYPYFLEFSNDDSIISINRIVEYYEKLYSEESKEDVINNIRKYAFSMVNMEAAMSAVIEYIKKG